MQKTLPSVGLEAETGAGCVIMTEGAAGAAGHAGGGEGEALYGGIRTQISLAPGRLHTGSGRLQHPQDQTADGSSRSRRPAEASGRHPHPLSVLQTPERRADLPLSPQ